VVLCGRVFNIDLIVSESVCHGVVDLVEYPRSTEYLIVANTAEQVGTPLKIAFKVQCVCLGGKQLGIEIIDLCYILRAHHLKKSRLILFRFLTSFSHLSMWWENRMFGFWSCAGTVVGQFDCGSQTGRKTGRSGRILLASGGATYARTRQRAVGDDLP
jgi:hypothetical protein